MGLHGAAKSVRPRSKKRKESTRTLELKASQSHDDVSQRKVGSRSEKGEGRRVHQVLALLRVESGAELCSGEVKRPSDTAVAGYIKGVLVVDDLDVAMVPIVEHESLLGLCAFGGKSLVEANEDALGGKFPKSLRKSVNEGDEVEDLAWVEEGVSEEAFELERDGDRHLRHGLLQDVDDGCEGRWWAKFRLCDAGKDTFSTRSSDESVPIDAGGENEADRRAVEGDVASGRRGEGGVGGGRTGRARHRRRGWWIRG